MNVILVQKCMQLEKITSSEIYEDAAHGDSSSSLMRKDYSMKCVVRGEEY